MADELSAKTKEKLASVDSESFKRGLKTRAAVLGDAYVNTSLESATEFSWPMQQLVTEHCWDGIWNRPGLSRRDRSLINLAMISALNRQHELKTHVRGALNNGLTPEEIREVFLQVAIYCGMPAAIDSFRTAQQVLDERKK
jgi:4-carboxymuconolactone decarboxylase